MVESVVVWYATSSVRAARGWEIGIHVASVRPARTRLGAGSGGRNRFGIDPTTDPPQEPLTVDALLSLRRFCAEEIEALCDLQTPALVEGLATVPREAFLPPGPWIVRSELDYTVGSSRTRDADPRSVYHNLAVAIDPERQLFDGAAVRLESRAAPATGLQFLM